jgi:hypothetical protein
MDAAEVATPSVSPPLTWAEICELYPDQHVCLVEIDRIHPRGLDFRSARVAGHGKTRREALDQALPSRDLFPEIGFRFTGQSSKPLIRPPVILNGKLYFPPTVILDDETRDALRRRP